MKKTNNIVEIKSKRAIDWIKKVWPDYEILALEYYRNEKFVRINYYLDDNIKGAAPLIEDRNIFYPILNSYKMVQGITTALSPYLMTDHYKKSGYFKVGGHNILTITGLKIHLKDIGIETRIIKRKNNKSACNTPYIKEVYKIYPKTDVDYAMFLVYFSDDIGSSIKNTILNIKPIHWQILPMSVKTGKITVTPKKRKK
jgi:hypothetical protein